MSNIFSPARLFTFFCHLVIVELIIGGKGYLWSTTIAGVPVSIRMILFTLLVFSWVVFLVHKKTWPSLLRAPLFLYPFLALFGALALAAIHGLLSPRSTALVVADANNWAFLLAIAIFFDLPEASPHWLTTLKKTIRLSIIALITKAWIFFVVFASGNEALSSALYTFERDTGGGQMASAANGLWRIYFWSELFLLPLLFLFLSKQTEEKKIWSASTRTTILLFATILLTLFRSFWAGVFVGLFLWLALMVYRTTKNIRTRALGALAILVFVTPCLWYGMQFLGTTLHRLSLHETAIQKQLFTASEPGIQNRINQLGPLLGNIRQSPILGLGFGSTVTYDSLDLRNLGTFTTTALEWGWLDMMQESGLVGVAAYLWLFIALLLSLYRQTKQGNFSRTESAALAAGLCAVVATHMVSPFLNHPIGIGYIAILLLYIGRREKTKKTPY